MKDININSIVEEYKKASLDCNPVYAPSNYEIIELIDCYFANKYRDNEFDSSGYKKAFFNIVVNPTEIAAKMIDLDTKDIRIVAEDGQSYYPAWLFGKELKIWMKDKKNKDGQTFGQLLNQMVYNFPKYGHLVAKKAKDTVHLVPIQNISCDDPTAKDFLSCDIVVEEHEYTPTQLRNQSNWKNIEDVIAQFENEGVIKVYEISTLDKDGDNYFIEPAGCNSDDYVLYQGRVDRKDLYKEIKWESMPGRCLGRGQVEKLFEAQIVKNRNEHYLGAGYRWSSRKLWQTRDDNVAKNLITEVEDGEVLTVNSEITPIAMEERNLSAIMAGDKKWDELISALSFSYEPLSGQSPKASTPLGTTVLQTKMAGQFYELKQEELGMFIKDILFEWIIPEFKSHTKKEHNLMLGEFDEDELTKLKDLVLTNKTNQTLIKQIQNKKRIPSAREMEMFRGIIREQISTQKSIEIPKDYYDNLKYKIDIIITGEQIDIASKLTTLQTILQVLGSNPTIFKDPRTKKVFYEILNLVGISPTNFQEEEQSLDEMVSQNAAKVAGSSPRIPTPTPQPSSIVNQQTI